MSTKIMTAIWDNTTGNLDAYETAYLVKLADYGPQVFPSVSTLSKKTRISKRKIGYLNTSLSAKGYLDIVERTRKNGSRTSNSYRLNVNKLLLEAGMEPMEPDELGEDPSAPCAPPPARRAPPSRTACTPYNQDLNQELKQKNNADQDDPRLIQFRKEYPGRGGTKKEIVKALKTALKKTTLEEIIKAIRRQKTERATCKPGKFMPPWKYPATWLNKECWTEEPIDSANDTRAASLIQMDEICRGAI